MPSTSVDRYLASATPLPDVLLLSDVMHHIPVSERHAFLAGISTHFRSSLAMRIIVKDVEPGFARSLLGYWADKYITGDKTVSPIGRAQMISLMQDSVGPLRCEDAAPPLRCVIRQPRLARHG